MYRGLDVFNVFLRVKVFTANDFSLLKLFRELWSNLRYSYLAKKYFILVEREKTKIIVGLKCL